MCVNLDLEAGKIQYLQQGGAFNNATTVEILKNYQPHKPDSLKVKIVVVVFWRMT